MIDSIGLRVLKRKRATPSDAPTGVGFAVHGNVLIIGEQGSDITQPNEPFCGMSGCSLWLNGLLDEANVPEERLYWINAKENDHSWADLAGVMSLVKPAHILPLGKTAEKLLTHNGVAPTAVFTHPQYWKRFHSKKPYPLIAHLVSLTEDYYDPQ